mmetsp:Transcript_35707/g.46978  ORF Transcript_35707/g.46978 Transcript_35707/m.46978 type:complete len:87 (+) Transcript_35707:104-364(+)
MFLSYDLQTVKQRVSEGGSAKGSSTEVQIERFINKDQNFSISWYPDLKALHQATVDKHLAELEVQRQKSLKQHKSKSGKQRREEKK